MLTYEERLELIPALSYLAEVYYDKPEEIHFGAGICYGLGEICNVEHAYGKMIKLMNEIGYSTEAEYFEGAKPRTFKSIEEWEPRAYMCLLLSEYLWASLDEFKDTAGPELTAEQSTFGKIKAKVKSLLGVE